MRFRERQGGRAVRRVVKGKPMASSRQAGTGLVEDVQLRAREREIGLIGASKMGVQALDVEVPHRVERVHQVERAVGPDAEPVEAGVDLDVYRRALSVANGRPG